MCYTNKTIFNGQIMSLYKVTIALFCKDMMIKTDVRMLKSAGMLNMSTVHWLELTVSMRIIILNILPHSSIIQAFMAVEKWFLPERG